MTLEMRLEFVAAVGLRRQRGEGCLADVGHRAGAEQGYRLHETGGLFGGDGEAVATQQAGEAKEGRGGAGELLLAPFTGVRRTGRDRRLDP